MSLQLHWQMEPPTSLLWVFTPATILIILTMEQASDPNSALLNRHRIKMTFPCSKASLQTPEEVTAGLDLITILVKILAGLFRLSSLLRGASIRVKLPYLPAHIVVCGV
uniref:Germanicol synthase n=1 Tax=Rhizophora mucronata TaxID=61149 RepID=A0A2P2MRX3_RHIMU